MAVNQIPFFQAHITFTPTHQKSHFHNSSSMHKRTIWVHPKDSTCIQIIDQRDLPHRVTIINLRRSEDAARAIEEMWVRGAPLIGATAAYGYYLACIEAEQQPDPQLYLKQRAHRLMQTRPTAINLAWALDRMAKSLEQPLSPADMVETAFEEAGKIVEEDVIISRQIGEHGLPLLHEIADRKPEQPINILTHCNAGRMATIEYGTATAPIYLAHEAGLPVHVWVDETRPRNQGAHITAWELEKAGIPHTVIVDNMGGHLMQHGQVDICLVGTDRTTRQGDVANKIGTYLKALAAHDNEVPFYVCLPSTTIDWNLKDGLKEIPIEARSQREVSHLKGWDERRNVMSEIRITPPGSPALNYGFDVTPGRYISGLITERGICPASEEGLLALFPEKK